MLNKKISKESTIQKREILTAQLQQLLKEHHTTCVTTNK